jgi:cytochrome b561
VAIDHKGKRTARFDGLTMAFHWTTLALVLFQFATALSIDRAPDPQTAALLLTLHRSAGVATWGVVFLRLAWRMTGMRLPPFPAHMSAFHNFGVHLSEYGMYALLLVQPLTGLGDTLLRGRAFELFGLTVPPLFARDVSTAARLHLAHEAGAVALTAVVLAHATAALFHGVVLKDGVLRSMFPGRKA